MILSEDFKGDDSDAIEFLQLRGYCLTRQWNWYKPGGEPPTAREIQAAHYLFTEWDWGYFITSEQMAEIGDTVYVRES